MLLSVIIPAYNEQERLPCTLESVVAYLKNQPYDYEIIVVDDASRDGTVKTVKSLMSRFPRLRLLENSQNHGKGFAVRQGLLQAKGDWRLFADADNSTLFYQVEKLLAERQHNDIVIASRELPGAVMSPRQPWLRRWSGKILKLLVYAVIGGISAKDTQCGFKLFSKKAAENILPLCTINRWIFDVEILKIAAIKGYEVTEVSVVWENDPRSTVRLSSVFSIIRDVCVLKWNLASGRYR